MAEKYDAVVVGAGIGGLACAALLAKWGLRPLVLEKNERTGGKVMTTSREGFTYEFWPIGITPINGHSFEALSRELGLESELKIISPKSITMVYKGRSGKWNKRDGIPSPANLAPGELPDPTQHFGLWELDAMEQELAIQVLGDLYLMTPEKVEALDAEDITLEQFLARHEVPGPIYNFLAFFANMAMVGPIDLVSAAEYVRVLQDAFCRGGGGYPLGGCGHVIDVLERTLKANGGDVRTLTRVTEITVDDGEVTGVVTEDGEEFKATIVISDAGIHPTVLKLVGEGHFDKSYVSYVKNLVPAWGLTGQRYFLSKPVLQWDMCTVYSDDAWWNLERYLKVRSGHVPENVIMYGMVTSSYDHTMAPPGKQLLFTATPCPADPSATEIKMLWDKVDEVLFKLWPEIVPVLESKEYAGPAEVSALTRDHVLPGGQGGECMGLGQVVGQCGRKIPSSTTPIQGLFLVGIDAGANPNANMGLQRSVNSAMNVARSVVHYHRLRQVCS